MTLAHRFEKLGPGQIARLPTLPRLAFHFAFAVARWHMLSATRRSLRRLDDHLLLDIGLEPGQAESECTKRFWQE